MKWFLNLRTSVKLISAFVAVAVILAAVGVYALSNLSMLNGNVKEVYNNNLVSVRDLSAAQINYQQMRVALREMSMSPDKVDKDKLSAEIDEYNKEFVEKMDSYRKVAFTKPEQDEIKTFDAAYASYIKLFDQGRQLTYQSDVNVFRQFLDTQLNAAGTKMRGSLTKLIDMNVDIAETTYNESGSAYSSARNIMIAVIIIAFLFSIFLGYYIAGTIANPLARIVDLVSKVAQGDLREQADIDTKDEVGQLSRSVNDMIHNLQSLIGGVIQSSQSVAAASEEISASTEEIAGSSTNQAQSAQHITDLFNELSSAINSVAMGAEQAAELSSETVRTANQGGKVIEESVAGMQAVNTKMSKLEEDSQRIGDIIEVIDDIADQTNLLALNAAIEAARAGDQGRGFAVVADEVRKLAERSSEATKQISSIIKVMQENTKQSVAAVMESVKESSKTGEAFQKIVAMVDASSNKVNEIAAACEQQSAQASEVMTAVQSIAAASEEAAAASEETAATCQSLANLADELNTSVAIFKIR
ncbi:methyl-accepting chemotaxis protein [Paenibacillus hemerocallicola]|uniref:Methyl-accepting chemotaxis protein n=1 Tax=Paenibacillus hemerocallicola TaxID=1172614 RepID=A0A5C4TEK5_9BACL|nr:methyl-accepting chemotaxis protein [Paenibacillus hemerocallicola]TNJ66849.1 methyl-accepting chemotaxis protein [Paenibacillus hemerocallicola]